MAGLYEAIADNPGETDSELVFKTGDIINVTSTDTGSDGWWEGELNGNAGFFPASFVVKHQPKETSPPAAPMPAPVPREKKQPPAPPAAPAASTLAKKKRKAKILFDCDTGNPDDLPVKAGDIVTFDDIPDSPEWVDAELNGRKGFIPRAYVKEINDDAPASAPPMLSPPPALPSVTLPVSITKTAKAAKPLPPQAPSSPSEKPSMPEPTLLAGPVTGPVPLSAPAEALCKIDSSFMWEAKDQSITVSLSLGEKKAKLGGLKKFISYTLITIPSGTSVERRYKHFDWLHARLTEKYPLLTLPTPPEKQFSGRFEQEFLAIRRRLLERYLNYMARHPVIRSCSVFRFFLGLDGNPDWKAGKRAAEKESKEVGSALSKYVDASAVSTAPADLEKNGEAIAEFKKFVAKYEKQLTAVREADASVGKARGQLAHELEKEAEKWTAMQERTCWDLDCQQCGQIAVILGAVRDARMGEHAGHKLEDLPTFLCDMSKDYCHFIGTTLDCNKLRDQAESAHQSASDKLTKMQAAIGASSATAAAAASLPGSGGDAESEELKALNEQAKKVDNLREVSQVSTAIIRAEMRHFHKLRLEDLRETLLALATRERDFYQSMVDKWSTVIQATEKLPQPN